MIHFVGAGPGAPDLITLRGAELLKQADVVIYAGSLVNPVLLGLCREDCRIYNSAEMTLEQVFEAFQAAQRDGKRTVRLHTGDPSIYGAIREQMDLLRAANIPFDDDPRGLQLLRSSGGHPCGVYPPGHQSDRDFDPNGGPNAGSSGPGHCRACPARRGYGDFSVRRNAAQIAGRTAAKGPIPSKPLPRWSIKPPGPRKRWCIPRWASWRKRGK